MKSGMEKISVIILLVILSMPPEISTQQCTLRNNSQTFGIGSIQCGLFLPYYSEYQWATCLTDEFIMRTSNGEHYCRDQSATTCWYQCQLELNKLDEGPVYDNCRCSATETLPTPDEEMPTLAPECFSPGGIDCSWYRQCLEARYPCQGTKDGYAIEYAEKYCNLFRDNYRDFSPSGRAWVDGVRKCLQLVLVPSLRPWVQKTCADLSMDAFDSHPNCYLNPGSGAPSICELPCLDAWKSFWIVNVVGDALTTAPVETGIQMLKVMEGCFGNIGGCTGIATTTVILAIPTIRTSIDFSLAAFKVTRYIANFLNLDSNRIGWFPSFNDDNTNIDMRRQRRNVSPAQTANLDDNTIMLLLVDLHLLNISNGTSDSVGQQTLEETISLLSDAVGNGVLSQIPVTINDTEVFFGVSSLGECGDAFCSNDTKVTQLATAPPPTTAASGTLLLCKSAEYSIVYILAVSILLLVTV